MEKSRPKLSGSYISYPLSKQLCAVLFLDMLSDNYNKLCQFAMMAPGNVIETPFKSFALRFHLASYRLLPYFHFILSFSTRFCVGIALHNSKFPIMPRLKNFMLLRPWLTMVNDQLSNSCIKMVTKVGRKVGRVVQFDRFEKWAK